MQLIFDAGVRDRPGLKIRGVRDDKQWLHRVFAPKRAAPAEDIYQFVAAGTLVLRRAWD